MDILATVRNELESRTWGEVQILSDKSGVPFHTLAKIRRGETKDPGVTTCEKVLIAVGKPYRSGKRAGS